MMSHADGMNQGMYYGCVDMQQLTKKVGGIKTTNYIAEIERLEQKRKWPSLLYSYGHLSAVIRRASTR